MHYYQFHIGDYVTHTKHLTLLEDLAFRRLLDHYYLHEQPIRQREIARQIGMRDHEQEVLSVLEEFFVSTEDGYINPRADKEKTFKFCQLLGFLGRRARSLEVVRMALQPAWKAAAATSVHRASSRSHGRCRGLGGSGRWNAAP